MDRKMQTKARQVFQLCAELSKESGRPISPDGHLVGGLGEIMAAAEYDLVLAAPSTGGYDASLASDEDVKVEIKATTRTSVTLSGESPGADRLVALQIDRDTATPTFFYWGPAEPAWVYAKERGSELSGQWTISLNILRKFNSNDRALRDRADT